MIKTAVCIILAYVSYIALFSRTATFFIPTHYFGGAVFIVATVWLYYKHDHKQIRRAECVFSVLLSLAHMLGLTFTRYDSFAMFTAGRVNILFFFVMLAGFIPFFYVITCLLVDKVLACKIEPHDEGRFSQFFAPFVLFLAAWLPYFIIYFPGNLINDAVRQLAQVEGITPFINAHPLYSTFFLGSFYRLGILLGNANLGLAFITIVHNVMMAAGFSLTLMYLKKWGVNYRVRLGVMVFYAAFPVFGIWAQTILKDTSAAVFMLLFILFYIDLAKEFTRKKLVLCFVAAIVASLFRSEVVFVVVPSIFALGIFYAQKNRRFVLMGSAIAVFIAVRLLVGGAMAITNAQSGSVRDVISIPIQQTARFMRYHEDRITPEERAVLAATFEDYYMIGELYHPRISDPVKDLFIEGTDLGAYLRTWAAMGLRAPRAYIEAAIAVSFSYVVPFGPDWMIVWRESSHEAIQVLERDDIGYVFSTYGMRIFPARVMEVVERLPFVGFFFHTGNYTWAMAFLVLLLIKRKLWREIIYFLPALMIILACIASPVHGFWRYYLSILYMFPVLLTVIFAKLNTTDIVT
ncbi:MAG: DUF6020 family protein [Defluviitaleaceae bacterium]|nr:DUF6020 family protein [Defluviitaleaceae bacterium]MCL2273779.1 DUF6020 family protein [Defluviitaleaceae bacterium]